MYDQGGLPREARRGKMMQMISYISESKMPADKQKLELDTILRTAQKRNAKLGISGVLFLRGNTFFQTFEGPTVAVQNLLQSILADDRHEHLYLLMNEPIDQRRFSSWSMECFHEPSFAEDYLGVMHQIGQHFRDETTFSPSGIYSYCWRMVAAMASCRLSSAV
ncbi:MAG: BLUF domain-containing protein [Litoreibacter sp.]